MTKLFTLIQIISAILLIAMILLQRRGTGLGAAFGGGGEIYRTKRGVEKILFIGTIILSITLFTSVLLGTIWK